MKALDFIKQNWRFSGSISLLMIIFVMITNLFHPNQSSPFTVKDFLMCIGVFILSFLLISLWLYLHRDYDKARQLLMKEDEQLEAAHFAAVTNFAKEHGVTPQNVDLKIQKLMNEKCFARSITIETSELEKQIFMLEEFKRVYC